MEQMFGELRVLQRLNKYEMAVELDLLRDGLIHAGGTTGSDRGMERGRIKNWEYRNIDRYYRTFAGKPLLIAYVGKRVGDGHNSQTRTDPETGDEYESYTAATAERIVGMVSEEYEDLTLIERKGNTWVRARGRIWTNYAPELTDKLQRTGRMSVSVETNVLESWEENGVEVMESWEGLGVTILGDGVAPAVPGANVRVLAAMEQEFEDMKLRVAALRKEEDEPQRSDPVPKASETEKTDGKGVKRRMNKKLMKELAAKFPDHDIVDAQDDGEVVLLSKNSVEAYTYKFEESDKGTVIPDRIMPADLALCVRTGSRDVEIDITRVTGFYDTEMARLARENKEMAERIEKLEAAQKEMEARECARRVKAAREAAERELRCINEDLDEDERFDEELIREICERCEVGEFSTCEDKDGSWNGEEAVCKEVRDVCMRKQKEMNRCRREAKRMASRKRFAFEPDFDGEGPADSFEAMYAAMVKDD